MEIFLITLLLRSVKLYRFCNPEFFEFIHAKGSILK